MSKTISNQNQSDKNLLQVYACGTM